MRDIIIVFNVLCLAWLMNSCSIRAQEVRPEQVDTPRWDQVQMPSAGRSAMQPGQPTQPPSRRFVPVISASDVEAPSEPAGHPQRSVSLDSMQSSKPTSPVYASLLLDEPNSDDSARPLNSYGVLELQPMLPANERTSNQANKANSTFIETLDEEGYVLQRLKPAGAVDSLRQKNKPSVSENDEISILPLSEATVLGNQLGAGKYSTEQMTGPMDSPVSLFSQLNIDDDYRQLGEHALHDQRRSSGHQGFEAPWLESSFAWLSPAFHYRPLYFEQPNLERYGIGRPCLSPVTSAAHFYSSICLLPYKMLAQPPCEEVYTLGHRRPGDCVPRQRRTLLEPARPGRGLTHFTSLWR